MSRAYGVDPDIEDEIIDRVRHLMQGWSHPETDIFRFAGFTLTWNSVAWRIGAPDGTVVYTHGVYYSGALGWNVNLVPVMLDALRAAMVLDDLSHA
ncbi:MAG: hypothetical protein AB7L09_01755 [Nitrospira sp.]